MNRRLGALALALGLGGCAVGAPSFIDPLAARAPKTPNWALAAPEGVDAAAEPTHRTPVVSATPEALLERVDAAFMAEPRVTRADAPPLARAYIQRSRIVGFPDHVTVRAIDLGDGRASAAIFSRSLYGRSDLGVNAARVERLLGALAE